MDYTQKQALPLIELTDEDTGLTCSDARDGFHFIALTALERSTLPDIVSINRPYKSSPKHESEYFATEDDGPIVSKFFFIFVFFLNSFNIIVYIFKFRLILM